MKRIILALLAAILFTSSHNVYATDYFSFREGHHKDIRPAGWIQEFLLRQQSGMTGHPDALSYPYNTCLWNGEIPRNSDYGEDWWRYEQTAYYTDGLLRLGYLIGDTAFINTGLRGIDYTIRHPQASGRLGNSKITSLWPMVVFARAMRAAYEHDGDNTILTALQKHYNSMSVNDLVKGRRHILNIEGMLWLYGLNGNKSLLTMAEQAYNKGGFELDATQAGSDDYLHIHGVTYCEMLKVPLLLYAYTGKQQYLDLALNCERKLERDHLLPDGVPTSSEYTEGKDIDIAHETCDITDYTWSLGFFLTVTGQAEWADRIEQAMFNAAEGCVTKDFRSLQYFSSLNQIACTGQSDNNAFKRGSTWMAYRPTHETECCAGNVNRMMPDFASRLWMRGDKGEVIAAMYSPSSFSFNVDGASYSVEEQTTYPFTDRILFTFHTSDAKQLPFVVRIPGWCEGASIKVNGKAWNEATLTPATYVTIDRVFADGDQVEVILPMEVKMVHAEGQGIYFQRGPLLYSYAVPTKKTEDTKVYANMNGKVPGDPSFKCWSMVPSGAYSFGVDEALLKQTPAVVNIREEKLNGATYPYDLADVPVTISIPVREIRWSLEGGRYNPRTPEPGNALAKSTTRVITLVPYGCTELRLTVFPETSEADIPASASASALTNPDFELTAANTYNTGGLERKDYVPYGWKTQGSFNGPSYGINHDANNIHGENVCWFRLVPFPANFELYQIIPARKLSAGRWKISCRLWCEKGNKGTCRLFAGDQVQYYGSEQEYTNVLTEGEHATYAGYEGSASGTFNLKEMCVFVDVREGETLRVGIRTDNRKNDGTLDTGGASGWFKVDHFRVEKVQDPTGVKQPRTSRITSQVVYTLNGTPIEVEACQPGNVYVQNGSKFIR